MMEGQCYGLSISGFNCSRNDEVFHRNQRVNAGGNHACGKVTVRVCSVPPTPQAEGRVALHLRVCLYVQAHVRKP